VIVTFYSYKGGVGRSMALANVAAWLSLQGLKVVMIDWDLEAPGLESFFATDSAERGLLRAKIGLVDIIGMYKDVFPNLPKAAAQFVEILDEMLPPIAHTLIPIRIQAARAGTGKLWLLSAGCRNDSRFNSYAQTVQQFDWEEFYAKYEGEAYFEWMRRQLLKPDVADVVLIDSRTGVAEMSGVCTRQLADVVVMLCAPNEQNLEGTAAMAKSFTRPDLLEARRGRPIELLPVPARVDVSEGRPVDLFEEQFRDRLNPFMSELLRRMPASRSPLRIPYIREYAYAEQLAIGDAGGVKILQQAYVTLAAHLVALAGSDSAIRRNCRYALQETFGLPTILVASLHPSNTEFASTLCARLDAAGIIAVYAAENPEAALETASAAPRITTPYGAMVLATQSYRRADTRIRDLWRRSRQLGVTLALAVEGESAGNEDPRWSRGMLIYDAAKDFSQLVNALKNPIYFAPIPFMAPPVRPGFVGRTREIEQIKELLGVTRAGTVASTSTAAPTRTAAIVGLGGIGKTALARAVCHDEDVIDRFDDGIVWMSLGSEADLLNAATAVLSAFGEDDSSITSIDEAERRLAGHLINKRCLVIVDGVFDVSHLKLFSSIGAQARAIITTRFPDIATAIGAEALTLPPLSPADAQTLVARQGLSPEIAAQISQKLDNQPLALELAEQTLRRGGSAKDLIRRIDDEGLTAIDTGNSRDTSASVFSSLMSALEVLPQEDRQRLPMLASLASSQPIELATFAGSSGIEPLAGEAMARRMAAMSLIAFDDKNQTVTISPLVHAFLRSLQLRQGRAEAIRQSRSEAVKGVIGISYRRDDTAGLAGRLYDRVSQHFGLDRVFMDIDANAILPGEDYVEAIRSRMYEASAWLVVIGPSWAESVNSHGERRLDDPDDFVRIEVATALKLGIPVIPVLVDGAVMPRSKELPADLQALTYRQAIALNHSNFNQGVDKLVYGLEHSTQPVSTPKMRLDQARSQQVSTAEMQKRQDLRRRRRIWAAGAAAVAAALLGLLALIGVQQRQTTNQLPRPSPVAIFEGAEDSYFGRGVPQNYREAAGLYKEAAADGYAPAANALARMYENGIGIPKDLALAIKYYKLAAAQGHPDAKAALSRLEAK
jgi:NB-ARC domain/TIR domain/Sel1 repeat/CobQ/CobB/MinD/ParA nucleotide binding domain